jgi:hypothetical protein
VLADVDARRQRLTSVAGVNGKPVLKDRGSRVEIRRDEVHGRTVPTLARFEHAAVGVEAWEHRQQGRMDVQ